MAVSYVKLFPHVEGARFGTNVGQDVAISRDGNTALLGSTADNAAYVFVQVDGVWEYQATLTPDDAEENPRFGISVALSEDGSTALVGGSTDRFVHPSQPIAGAAWFFTRSGSTWAQHGAKHIADSPLGESRYGTAVALSADGLTAVVGDPFSYNERDVVRPTVPPGDYTVTAENVAQDGVAYVLRRDGGDWATEATLIPDVTGPWREATPTHTPFGAFFGGTVAISADGNVVAVGGRSDVNESADATTFFLGSVWTYYRSGGSWSVAADRLKHNIPQTVGAGNGMATVVALSGNGRALLASAGLYFPDYPDAYANVVSWVLNESGGVVGTAAYNLVSPGDDLVVVNDLAINYDGDAGLLGSGVFDADNEIYFDQAFALSGAGGVWSGDVLDPPASGNSVMLSGIAGEPGIEGVVAGFGWRVSMASDGSGLVGGAQDADGAGAGWVYVDENVLNVLTVHLSSRRAHRT